MRLVNADGSFGGWSGWGGNTTVGTWLPGGHGAGTFVLGEHGFRATGYRYGAQGAAVRVSDITLDGNATADFYIQGSAQPRFTALEGGELFASYSDGSTGGPSPAHEAVQLANALYVENGSFIGSSDGAIAMRSGEDVEISNTEWPEPGGGQQAPNSSNDTEFVITVNVFIPEEWVDSPIPGMQLEARVFGGDGRGFSRTGSSRIHQEVRVGRTTSWQKVKIGKTTEYDKSSSVDSQGHLTAQAKSDTQLNDGFLKVGEALAPADGVSLRQTLLPANFAKLVLKGAVKNQLVQFSPTIDYEIRFLIDFTDRLNPTYSVSGEHDGFPNYETYVNEQRVHHYSHGNETPISLFPPAEKSLPSIHGSLRQ